MAPENNPSTTKDVTNPDSQVLMGSPSFLILSWPNCGEVIAANATLDCYLADLLFKAKALETMARRHPRLARKHPTFELTCQRERFCTIRCVTRLISTPGLE